MNRIDTRLLKSLMALKGMTQKDLAKASGSSERNISFIMNCKTTPNYYLMLKIAKALEMTPDEARDVFFTLALRDTKEGA